MMRLALRNIGRQRARTAMTLGAIALGVAGLILSGGFVADILHQLGEAIIHSQTGHIQLARKDYFTIGSRSPERYLIEDAERIRRDAAAVPGVTDVLARVQFSGLLSNGRSDLAIIGEGMEPEKEAALGTFIHIVAGRNLKADDAYGVMLGEGVAKALKLAPGDRTVLLVNTAEGAINSLDLEVKGVFRSFSKDYDARAVRIALPAAHELLNHQGANLLVIALADTAQTDSTAAALRQTLGPAIEARTFAELSDFYTKAIDLYSRQFGVLRLIILFMVLLSVANSVNMSVFERVAEFGTMKALGNRGGDVFALVLLESLVLGGIGALLGAVAGIGLGSAISAVGIPMPPPPNAELGYTAYIRMSPELVGMALAVGLVATVLAALLPARRVARYDVAEALRHRF